MRSNWLPLMALTAISLFLTAKLCSAQPPNDGQPKVTQAELESLINSSDPAATKAATNPGIGGLNFLKLLVDGGALMIPIGLMSLVVLAVGIERTVALRNSRVFPRRLRREIRRAVDAEVPMSPPELFRAAELVPSSASRVLVDMLAKVGRPIAEVEDEISDSVQREADRLYGNVRWLTLAAAVTPLIGLLGTVWGLILAFYNTTQLADGGNRVESLAEGIYIALVTTLGGLTVAIPAAMLAHYFEGRITKALNSVDVELRRLTRWFEQYEGKMRFDIGPKGISSRTIAAGGHSTSPSPPSSPEPPPHSTVRAPRLKA